MQKPPTQVVEIAANIDDVGGEVVGAAIETLLAEGALDAWTVPIGMKKNRPGVMVSLLCPHEDRDRLARRLMELTGSFGVRFRDWDRLVLERRHEVIQTEYGPIRLKVGCLDGHIVSVKPEFDDVKKAAQARGLPVRQVLSSIPTTGHPASRLREASEP